MSKLIETGLVRRQSQNYHLTSMGKIVYSAQALIENAVKDYWKLKALDTLNVSMHPEEHDKIVDTIIDNQKIKNMILLRQT